MLLGSTSVMLAAGMLAKTACVPSGWAGENQPYAELCWSDLAGVSADSGTPPHVTTYVTGLAERLGAMMGASGVVATTAVLAVGLAVFALLATALLVRVDPHRPWAVAGWALAPVLAFHWLSWELPAAVGVAVLLWGWSTGRPVLAGVGAGVGAAIAFPVAAGLIGVLAVGGRVRDRVVALLSAVVALTLVSLPGLARVEDADVGSVWLLVEQAVGALPAPAVRLAVGLVVLLLAGVGVGRLRRSAGRTGTPSGRATAGAGLLLLSAALLVAPSVPPESALLLLPLAAIAVSRWRDLLVWQACELLSWVFTGWYLGGAVAPSGGGDSAVYWLAILLRLVGVAWLMAAVLRGDVSVDEDPVEGGRGEPDPDVDLLPDRGDARA